MKKLHWLIFSNITSLVRAYIPKNLEEIQSAFPHNPAALQSFIEQLDEWDDLLLYTVMSHYGPESRIEILSQWIISKTFLKSTKLTNKGAFHSIQCSTMFLRAKDVWATSSCSEPYLFLSEYLVQCNLDTI